jgi:hypothetical protein
MTKSTKRQGPVLSFRLTERDRDIFKAAAKRDGFDAVSTWVKWLVRQRIDILEREASR